MLDLEQEKIKASNIQKEIHSHISGRRTEAGKERDILRCTLRELNLIKDEYQNTIDMLSPIYLTTEKEKRQEICVFSDEQLIEIMRDYPNGLTLLEANEIVMDKFGPKHSYTTMRRRMRDVESKGFVFRKRESQHRIVWIVKENGNV